MSETKFTPGPWKAVIGSKPPQRQFSIRAAGRCVAHYLSFDDHARFAYDVAEPDHVEANAHLIAVLVRSLQNG